MNGSRLINVGFAVLLTTVLLWEPHWLLKNRLPWNSWQSQWLLQLLLMQVQWLLQLWLQDRWLQLLDQQLQSIERR